MSKEACWVRMDCGKGPKSDDPCVVVDASLADGFLDGTNGSRACFYLRGTTCFGDDQFMSIPEKMKTYCINCEFFKKIQLEEGISSNIFYFLKHLHDRLEKEGRIQDLPVIQHELFYND